MLATVVIAHNPFDPTDRTIKRIRKGRSIKSLAPKVQLPFVAVLNGAPVLRANNGWDIKIKPNDILVFVVRQQGGGGGSNPLKVVLMIGLSIAAPWAAQGLALPLGLTTEVSIGILSGALGIAGKMLINAMMPDASGSSNRRQQTSQSASPTYNLSAQGNTARLLEPIPVQYGRHLAYPDFVAEPYTEYDNNEQYLYQLFLIGQGEYAIEQIRIEDTPIDNFSEVTYQVVGPFTSVSLFPTNVVTAPEVSGQELTLTTVGPFVANPAGTLINEVAIDVVCPRGLFYANDDGGLDGMSLTFKSEARAINDSGVATGSWVTLGTETISGATATPIRKTYRYIVSNGRYEVRMTRVDVKNTNSRAGHEVLWATLRSYIPSTRNFGNVTLLAMRIRATNNLSQQSSRRVNVISTRKLPIWNGAAWLAPAATQNPAWAMADVLRAKYGGKLANNFIDLAQLTALAAIYDARGDTFNARFDSSSTIFEALSVIGLTVRTKPYQQGGAWHFWRDQPQTLPVAMFNMRNIMRGSVKAQYLTPTDDTADCLDIEFFNQDKWNWDVVRAKLPGATEENPAKFRILGITNRAQAWREGMYQCAANRYRRNLITINTEMEGFIPTYGDLVAVQHDRPRWGQAGDVLAYDTGTKTVTTSEPLDWSAGGNHYFRFKQSDGSGSELYLTTPGAQPNLAILAVALSFTPFTGIDRERTSYNFGPSSQVDKLCLVRSLRPRSLENVELNFVVEDAAVHTADTGAAPPASEVWNLPVIISRPVVTGINVTLGGSAKAPLLNVVWLPASGAQYYHVEYSYDSQNTWQRAGEPSFNQMVFSAKRGNVVVRVRAIGRTVGEWEYWSGDPYAVPPANVSSFLVNVQPDGTRQFDATMPGGIPADFAGYQIRYRLGTGSWGWDDLQPMHNGYILAMPFETNQLSAGLYTFAIKGFDDSGYESEAATFITADLADPRLAGVIYNVLPHTQGWPGTKTNCFVESDSNILSAADSSAWQDLTTWDAYTQWVQNPAGVMTYQHTTIDLGGVVPFTPLISVAATGSYVVEEQHSSDGVTYTSWAAIAGFLTTRYVRIRVTVTDTFPRMQGMNIIFNGNAKTEQINDLATSSLTGSYRIGVGDIRLPIIKDYSLISQVNITLQNVGAGWTWEVVDKDVAIGPRIKIYNASNALADATIDAFIRGY